MKIQIAWEKITPTDTEKNMVVEKLSSLDKYLLKWEEDLKVAEVRIVKRSRWGFRVKFDMQLPNKHVFATEVGVDLTNVVVAVREEAERQIKEYVERLRGE